MIIADRISPDGGNPIERIQANSAAFSKTQRKIAAYILDHYDKVIFFSSAMLGQKCEVSESSVIRFATTIGYSGYSEMQREIQEYFKRHITLAQRLTDISENSGSGLDIFHDVMQKSIEGIRQMGASIDKDSFLNAVDLLTNAERVFLVGSRSSYGMIHFLGLNLGWIRRGVYVINGEGHEFDVLSSLTARDVVLAISMPHYLKSTIKALEYAFRKKACTICITDTERSPVVQFSTVPLLVHNEILSYSDNIVPVACLITTLLNAVGAGNRMEAQRVLTEREEFWRECDVHAKL